MQKNALLIELGTSHTECLLSQIQFLVNGGYKVCVAVNEKFIHQSLGFEKYISLFLNDESLKENHNTIINQIFNFIAINQIDIVVFNTATGKLANKILNKIHRKANCFGIMHNTDKHKGSLTQYFITRKLRGYYVLSPYLLLNIPKRIKVDYFLPIHTNTYSTNSKIQEDSKQELRIVIPGQVELKRRNYLTLIEELTKYPINKNIKFIALGRCSNNQDTNSILESIEANQLNQYFTFYQNFVPEETMVLELQKADFVLPLIYDQPTKNNYSYRNRISGAFNLAYSYKKPLMLPNYFNIDPCLRDYAFFGDIQQIVSLIFNESEIQKEKQTLIQKINNSNQTQFEFQQTQFLNFLNNRIKNIT